MLVCGERQVFWIVICAWGNLLKAVHMSAVVNMASISVAAYFSWILAEGMKQCS